MWSIKQRHCRGPWVTFILQNTVHIIAEQITTKRTHAWTTISVVIIQN